jgi:septal ring factor EnvC (AmiA/AmiB activator)
MVKMFWIVVDAYSKASIDLNSVKARLQQLETECTSNKDQCAPVMYCVFSFLSCPHNHHCTQQAVQSNHSLKQQIATQSKTIEELTIVRESLKNNISECANRTQSLDTQIKQYEENIQEMKNVINRLESDSVALERDHDMTLLEIEAFIDIPMTIGFAMLIKLLSILEECQTIDEERLLEFYKPHGDQNMSRHLETMYRQRRNELNETIFFFKTQRRT